GADGRGHRLRLHSNLRRDGDWRRPRHALQAQPARSATAFPARRAKSLCRLAKPAGLPARGNPTERTAVSHARRSRATDAAGIWPAAAVSATADAGWLAAAAGRAATDVSRAQLSAAKPAAGAAALS